MLTTARTPRSCPSTTTSECSTADAQAGFGHRRAHDRVRRVIECCKGCHGCQQLAALALLRRRRAVDNAQHKAVAHNCLGLPAVRPAVLSSIACFPAIEPGVDATEILSFRQLQMKLGTQQRKDHRRHSGSVQRGWGCDTEPFLKLFACPRAFACVFVIMSGLIACTAAQGPGCNIPRLKHDYGMCQAAASSSVHFPAAAASDAD